MSAARAALATLALTVGCGPIAAGTPPPRAATPAVESTPGRPRVARIVRQGDPGIAVAVAVRTDGLGAAPAPEGAAALAGLVAA
ncbi:MAG: hypothetical protein KC657_29690, partial [Myxococcales bacterium]|nr:hypothetical protein [Myxococcales bacterium]